MSVPDEGYSNLLTMSVPDEGYSNLMTLSIPDEGFQSFDYEYTWWRLFQSYDFEYKPDEGYSRNVSYILKLDINFLVNRGQAKSPTQYLIKKGEK